MDNVVDLFPRSSKIVEEFAAGNGSVGRTFLADDARVAKWRHDGTILGEMEESHMWWIAEWWREGQAKLPRGMAKRIVTAPDWKKPKYGTCRTALSVANRFPPESRRLDDLDFCHYQAVQSLPDHIAYPLLQRASAERWSVDHLRKERRRQSNGYYKKTDGNVYQTLPNLIATGKKARCILAD